MIRKYKLPLIVFSIVLILLIGGLFSVVIFNQSAEESIKPEDIKPKDTQLPRASESAKKSDTSKSKDGNIGKVAGTGDTNAALNKKGNSKKTPTQKSNTNQTTPLPSTSQTPPPSTSQTPPKDNDDSNDSLPQGFVTKGQLIAYQGNTGCSTGSHLAFKVYKEGVTVNPKPYLDSGEFRWPLANPTVTQWFGANYWWYMNNFGLPGNQSIDMVEYHGAPIYAAADGILTRSSDASACSLTNTVGQGVIIDHGNGLKSVYWHIQ